MNERVELQPTALASKNASGQAGEEEQNAGD